MDTAVKNHPDSSVFVNSASGEDALHFATDALKSKQVLKQLTIVQICLGVIVCIGS